MQKANLNCNVLKNYFDFLIKQGAVEERCVEKDRIVYGITERGVYLIRYFKELDQVIPTRKIGQSNRPEQRRNLGRKGIKYIVN
jgi:hypothetical protein